MIIWKLTKDENPLTWQTGDWDGLKSDLCICQDFNGLYHLAHFYEYNDRESEWYDKDDCELNDIVKWSYVEKPLDENIDENFKIKGQKFYITKNNYYPK